jgi:Zn-dependent protease
VLTTTTVVLIGTAIPSIILHEISHGVVALLLGDDTARRAGRLTLNPVRHIDVFGTIILPSILALSTFGVFGYAKPMPTEPSRMRHPRGDPVIVGLAGPATNLLLAALAALWLRQQHAGAVVDLVLRGFLGLDNVPWRLRIPIGFGIVNVVLAVFQLLPVPPLDGSAVVQPFLPDSWRYRWDQLHRYGIFIILGLSLLRPGLLSFLYNPALRQWQKLA